MRDQLRGKDVLGWAAIGVAAAAVVVASVVPAVGLAIHAYIGAGATQRTFRYARDVSFAGDLRSLGLVPLVAGLLLLAAATLAIARGSRAWIVLGSFAVALGLGWFALATSERLGPEAHAVGEYHGVHGILQPGLHELQAEARRSPEARDPGWTLIGEASADASENDYSADLLAGWRVLAAATLVLLWLTAYRVARLRLGPRGSIVAVSIATAVAWAWILLRALNRSE